MNAAPARLFKKDAGKLTRDLEHRRRIHVALNKYQAARNSRQSAFQSWEEARTAAAEVKYEAVNRLDQHLLDFARRFEARGGKVHWASSAAQARQIIVQIIQQRNARSIVKSKAMTTEEIHLNEALEKAGFKVIESDLGEYIVQLRKEAPYHFVFPAMHLTRGEISELFERELGTAPTDNPEELTMIARRVLRKHYITADVGITGGNFAIAETGMISITENEGNARLTAALPKTMISVMGIEKVLPQMKDLALFLPLLATAGAGQAMTCYNSMYGGPRQADECDGPEEFHVVLLDNNRTQILADPEQRDTLHCIRCGACLNVCPIYRNVGGHTYGTTYQGPIGSVITPHLRGLQTWKHLSGASSLCGACTETCPVKIDLHHHLLHNRRNAATEKPVWWERTAWQIAGFVLNHPLLFRLAGRFARIAQYVHPVVKSTLLDPARAWSSSRELPRVAKRSFADYWNSRS